MPCEAEFVSESQLVLSTAVVTDLAPAGSLVPRQFDVYFVIILPASAVIIRPYRIARAQPGHDFHRYRITARAVRFPRDDRRARKG